MLGLNIDHYLCTIHVSFINSDMFRSARASFRLSFSIFFSRVLKDVFNSWQNSECLFLFFPRIWSWENIMLANRTGFWRHWLQPIRERPVDQSDNVLTANQSADAAVSNSANQNASFQNASFRPTNHLLLSLASCCCRHFL